MADFIWARSNIKRISRFEQIYGDNIIQPTDKLLIFGKDETYTYIQKGDDFVTILGYCCYPGESIQYTGLKIFETFNELTISFLKKQLVGQFILIIKKKGSIYIFGDFLHVRNIFYSKDFNITSTSFSVIEDIMGSKDNDLDINRVVEYVAMKQILYPGWIGNRTMHTNIQLLRLFEYIVVDNTDLACRVCDTQFSIDNKKEFDINKLSSALIDNLKSIIENPNLKNKKIGITLTGGYDSRLIAAIASNYYKKAILRIATSHKSSGSVIDSKIAGKVAKTINIPLETYLEENKDVNDRFYFLKEGLSPIDNSLITPIIEKTGNFCLGFGGCFGTELFMPLDFRSIEDFIEVSITKIKKNIKINEKLWHQFRNTMFEEFNSIKKHYSLSEPNPNDEIRIFLLLRTAFLSSSMLSPYNINGRQTEPYGHLNILEIALRIPQQHIGTNKSFRGTALVQKKAMSDINSRIGKITTTHFLPMLPYSATNFTHYLFVYLIIILKTLIAKIKKKTYHCNQIIINELCYLSKGWDSLFLRRIQEKYNVNVKKQKVT